MSKSIEIDVPHSKRNSKGSALCSTGTGKLEMEKRKSISNSTLNGTQEGLFWLQYIFSCIYCNADITPAHSRDRESKMIHLHSTKKCKIPV